MATMKNKAIKKGPKKRLNKKLRKPAAITFDFKPKKTLLGGDGGAEPPE